MQPNIMLAELVETLQRSNMLIEMKMTNESGTVFPEMNIPVESLEIDSRKLKAGAVFFAIRGEKSDGHLFVDQVCDRALALVVEDLALAQKILSEKAPTTKILLIHVKSVRKAVDILAGHYYGVPSQRMVMYGVTGTNGKTSTTYMLEWVLEKLKIPTGVIGTIDHHFRDKTWSSEMTTPDAISLQKRLAEMKDAGAHAVAMEVSSHGLSQNRNDTVHFNTVIFTNLTRDHLDYHKTMNDYFQAKQKLFNDLLWSSFKFPVFAVINIDDPFARKLQIAGRAGLIRFGSYQKHTAYECEFRYKIKSVSFTKTAFSLHTPFGDHEGELPMCGEHNVANAMGVVAAVTTLGVPIATVLSALTDFPGVPGRLQIVKTRKNLNVFVDYAHTPDALENVLKSLAEVRLKTKDDCKIWTVFGCGGDRDAGKRPLMAAIAEKLSDNLMVTSDNPRTEDPEKIIADILKGLAHPEKAAKETDRRFAIEQVLRQAKQGDVVLIAGKGHEDYQIIGTQKFPFSDVKIAEEVAL